MTAEGDADCFVRFGVGSRIDGFGGSVAAGGWVVRSAEGRIGDEGSMAWLRGGLKSGFGIFVFKALDHALERRVEELEPFSIFC